MERIKKNFGFGCMGLPMKRDEVEETQVNQMIDTFVKAGFNYFDTAHGYLDKKPVGTETLFYQPLSL